MEQRDATAKQSDSTKSAKEMKQQLFALIEACGISNPEALTRKELESALQKLDIANNSKAEIPAMLDALDKILYTPLGEKIPESTVTKVNALMATLKKGDRSR